MQERSIWKLDSGERHLRSRYGPQQTQPSGLVCGAAGIAFVQPRELASFALKGLTDLDLDQRQEPQGEGQQARRAHDLVIVSHMQRADAQGKVLEEVKVALPAP